MIKTFGRQRFWIKRNGTQLPLSEKFGDFQVTPTEEDFKNATPGDAFNCMYARYFMRAHGSTEVCIEHGVAFVELPDAKGRLWMARFILSAQAKANEKKFDLEEELPPHTVTFKKPSKSRTLAAQELAHVSWELNQLKKAAGKGPKAKLTPQEASKPRRKAHMVGKSVKKIGQVATLRKSGKGMIQFRPQSA